MWFDFVYYTIELQFITIFICNPSYQYFLPVIFWWESFTGYKFQFGHFQGNNIVATAQTGSGKTGAFMIPLIQKCLLAGRQKVFPTYGIVLAPSRELAEQIGSVGRAISKGTHVTVGRESAMNKKILVCPSELTQ